jgi:hypothetical protein
VTLLGVVLASLACLDKALGVDEGGRPVETMSEGFPHEGAWRRVVSTDAAMDVKEQLPPILRGDAPQEYFGGALAIELLTEDSIALGMLD